MTHRLTKTQFELLDWLKEQGGRGMISRGARTLKIGVDRTTREPLAVCNDITIWTMQHLKLIRPVAGANLPCLREITTEGRIARCRETYRRRKRR